LPTVHLKSAFPGVKHGTGCRFERGAMIHKAFEHVLRPSDWLGTYPVEPGHDQISHPVHGVIVLFHDFAIFVPPIESRF
jgi:hypothetical protein